MDRAIPAKIGKYEVIRELGQGATSTVYLAADAFGNRDVAIKLIDPDALKDPHAGKFYRKQLTAEAALAGKLVHPHIVAIYDAVLAEDTGYIVMEYVGGGTLEKFTAGDNLLRINRVLEIGFKCCRALEFAQRHGIIHRDIKPANILLTPIGDIKISDFGSALLPKADSTQVTGIGSPGYMSPEQVEERSLTHHSDVYSLGVVLYQLLTGRLPFAAGSQASMIYQIINLDPPRPRDLRAELPEELERIVLKAMQKRPEARYANWDDFASELAAVGNIDDTQRKISDTEKFSTLKALSFFKEFSDVELWEVTRISVWTRHGPGTVLIQEGAPGISFYILGSGEVKVTKEGGLLNTLGAGDPFGEMAYLGRPVTLRTASVETVTDVTAIKIDAAALDAASDNCQLAFNRAFLRILVERLSSASSRLTRLLS